MSEILERGLSEREKSAPVEDLIRGRWSPRAMKPEPVSDDQIESLFEAARWAPSTYNEQEWRFSYAVRGDSKWDLFFSFLVEGNQAWCSNAGLLIVATSRKKFTRNGKDNPVYAIDCGHAAQNIYLQATSMGLVAHGMAGIEQDKIRKELNIPEVYEVHCMIAVGKPGKVEDLPEELRDMEKPSGRKSVSEISERGSFSFE